MSRYTSILKRLLAFFYRLLFYGMECKEHKAVYTEEGEVVCSICGIVLEEREEEAIQECYNNYKPGLYQEGTLGTLEGLGKGKQPDDSKIANICIKLGLDSSIGFMILTRYNEYKKVIRNRAKAVTFAIYYALIKHGIFRSEEEINRAVQMQFNTKSYISFKNFTDSKVSKTELERFRLCVSGNRLGLLDNNTIKRILEVVA